MRRRPRGGRLVRRTFLVAFALVGSGLLASTAIELLFRYRESVEAIWMLQREMAQGAAFKIQQFILDIEKAMRASSQSPDIVMEGLTDAFEFQLVKLLKIAPAVTTVTALDATGRERYKLSRIEMVKPGGPTDSATHDAYVRARGGRSHFGSVYFVRESEPYARIAVPIERFAGEVAGVLVSEVNLKYIWNVVSDIHPGTSGYAYVVSSEGELIAHPDIGLVLKRPNLRDLGQVKAALSNTPGPLPAQQGFSGQSVFAAYASITDLGWVVLVERATAEAYAPLYASLSRLGALLLIGLAMAVLASLLISFRVVRPLQALRQGAARIGRGALDHEIEIATGDELEALADEFNEMTRKLRESYDNIERVSHLKRFFSPQLAEFIVSSGEAELTESHRQDITVVFCDLRNFTEFSSGAEPEDAMRVLREYFDAICSRLREFEATIEHFAGDGLMAFFNDPVPCPDPTGRAVRMAVAMRQDVDTLIAMWRKRGIRLGFGIGISSGYATLGHVGSADQFHYAVTGSVANLASRLCDEASSGQILVTERVSAQVEGLAEVEAIGERAFKGFPSPVPVLQIVRLERNTGGDRRADTAEQIPSGVESPQSNREQ